MKKRKEEVITRREIVTTLTTKLGVSTQTAVALLESFMSGSTDGLKKDGILKLTGFGTFNVLKKKKRPGRNPKTGKEIAIPPMKSVSFHASRLLRHKVNAGNKNK